MHPVYAVVSVSIVLVQMRWRIRDKLFYCRDWVISGKLNTQSLITGLEKGDQKY